MTVADGKLPKWDCPRCGAPVHQVLEFFAEFECGTTQERGGAIREHRSCLIRQVADLKSRLARASSAWRGRYPKPGGCGAVSVSREQAEHLEEALLGDCEAKAAALEAGRGK